MLQYVIIKNKIKILYLLNKKIYHQIKNFIIKQNLIKPNIISCMSNKNDTQYIIIIIRDTISTKKNNFNVRIYLMNSQNTIYNKLLLDEKIQIANIFCSKENIVTNVINIIGKKYSINPNNIDKHILKLEILNRIKITI